MAFGSNGVCKESLTFSKYTMIPNEAVEIKRYCNENVTQLRMDPIVDSVQKSWNLTYIKMSSGSGGRFWMQIEGKYPTLPPGILYGITIFLLK